MTDTDADGDRDRPLSSLPDAWNVWNRGEDGRLVLAYRPDVFDAEEFPAACLPTLYLTHGRRTRRPGNVRPDHTTSDWWVTFYLEPEVTATNERFPTREAALERGLEVARAFDDGEIDYRDVYQVPREAYFERLDELTGRRDGDDRT